MANNVDPYQTAPIGAVCSGSTLFASILNLSAMLVNYLQQTTSADFNRLDSSVGRVSAFGAGGRGFKSNATPLLTLA